jgi:hypothetical protein
MNKKEKKTEREWRETKKIDEEVEKKRKQRRGCHCHRHRHRR